MQMNSPQMKNIITKSRDNGPKKALHARHPYDSQKYVDVEASNKWLINADLFAETEGFLTGIQDQVILKINYKKYILKQPDTDELCRRCGRESETIQHITATREQLAATVVK